MLVVKTFLKSSILHGIGLYAGERILKDRVVWIFDPRFDIFFDPKDVLTMTDLQKKLIDYYAYFSTETGKYVYCIDDTRFLNHSSLKNNLDVFPYPGEPETRVHATRDIEPGEELLINYLAFDAYDQKSDEDYLKT